MRKIAVFFAAGFGFILFSLPGCGYVATPQDVSSVQSGLGQRIDTLDKTVSANYKYFAAQTSALEKKQVDTQANIMQVSSDIQGQLKDMKAAIDENTGAANSAISGLTKSQDEKNFEFRRDIAALKKSQNDLLMSLSALNTGIGSIQNDMLTVKSMAQQASQNAENANQAAAGQARLAKSFQTLQSETNAKLKLVLSEMVRQESQILVLHKQLAGLLASGSAARAAKRTKKYYTVKRGDTLLKLSREFHVSVAELCRTNKIEKKRDLLIGEKLRIP